MALRVVTLDEIKAQMREDYDGEDKLILLYGGSAEKAVIKATRRTFEELEEMGKSEGEEGFPEMLKLAILMLAAHSYRVREPVASAQQSPIAYTLDYYIKPYVKLSNREV